jgi:hypothetical protein
MNPDNGYKYVMTMLDRYSKYLIGVPLKKIRQQFMYHPKFKR